MDFFKWHIDTKVNWTLYIIILYSFIHSFIATMEWMPYRENFLPSSWSNTAVLAFSLPEANTHGRCFQESCGSKIGSNVNLSTYMYICQPTVLYLHGFLMFFESLHFHIWKTFPWRIRKMSENRPPVTRKLQENSFLRQLTPKTTAKKW